MPLVCSQERRVPAARESGSERVRDASGVSTVRSVLTPALTRFHAPGPMACHWDAARNAAGPRLGKAARTVCAMSQGRWRFGQCSLLLSSAFTHLAVWHAQRSP